MAANTAREIRMRGSKRGSKSSAEGEGKTQAMRQIADAAAGKK